MAGCGRRARAGVARGGGAGVHPRRAVPGGAARRPAAEKKTLHASEQARADVAAARAAWRAAVMGQVDPDRLVFPDESGLDTRLTRPQARAPRRRRAVGRVPGGTWRRPTILGAMARDGSVAVMTVAAATSTAVFLACVEGVLIPARRARPEALVVMDNLAPHKAAGVRAVLGSA